MADIVKAIEREKEYLSYRAKGEEPFHLIDAVKECGFESLDEYFNAKAEYLFDKLNFAYGETPPNEAIANIFLLMGTKETKVLFVPSKETFVFSGTSKAFNEEYCKANNIPIYPLYTGGGTIVSTEGDFSLVICYPENTSADINFILGKLKEIFDTTMSNVTISGNDILLNGMKICGSVMYRQNGMMCFAAHFSFKDNSELIEQICGVSGSVKTPTTIDGFTVNMFKKAVREWLRIQ